MGSATKLRIGDVLLQHAAFFQLIAQAQPRMQFVPDACVRPSRQIVVGRALHIQSRNVGRTHAEQGEAALVIGIDQFLGRGRGLGQNSQPRERVGPFKNGQNVRWNGSSRNSVKSVASGDELAAQLMLLAGRAIADTRFGRIKAQRLGFEDDFAAVGQTRRHQILDHLLLGVDSNGAAGQFLKIDATDVAAKANLDAAMHQSLALQAPADAHAHHQVDCVLLQNSGSNAMLDVLPSVRFEHY
jgi:hypothetical protein